MKKIILILLVALTVSCQKEDIFPKIYHNIKATNCTYFEDGGSVHFTYVSNTPRGPSYKLEITTGYCKPSDIKEFSEDYLWMYTCYITKIGFAYME